MTESKVSPVLERAKRLTPLIQAYRMKAEDACRMLREGIAAARTAGDTHALGEMEGLLSAIE